MASQDASIDDMKHYIINWARINVRTEDIPLLRASIIIFFRLNYTDVEIVIELADYGYIIILIKVKRIRLEIRLRRRMSVFDK